MTAASTPLVRTARLLDSIAATRDGLTLNQIAERTGLPLATAHRVLRGLRDIGYVAGEGGRAPWRLGPRLLRLMHYTFAPDQLASLAGPVLQLLVDEFAHVAFLTRLGDDGIELMATVFPHKRLASLVQPGRSFPLHASASGKAIYAAQPAAVLNAALSAPLHRYTPGTITDGGELRRHLALVRRQGFAESDEEMDPGVYALACPVPGAGAGVLQAVALVDLKPRFFDGREREQVVAVLQRAAGRLSALLPGGG